jgi:transcriptional regulator with XRE-family HTH domain
MSATEIEADGWLGVGSSIRERRRAAGLTLVALAERTLLSQPFLSQVENGRARPSMASLYRIAVALDTTPQALFDGPAAVPLESIGGDRDAVVRMLMPGDARAHLVEFDGLPEEFMEYWSHDGFEVAYVVAGEVEAEVDGRITRLAAGGVLSYDASLPHRYRGVGAHRARLLLIEVPGAHGARAGHAG